MLGVKCVRFVFYFELVEELELVCIDLLDLLVGFEGWVLVVGLGLGLLSEGDVLVLVLVLVFFFFVMEGFGGDVDVV